MSPAVDLDRTFGNYGVSRAVVGPVTRELSPPPTETELTVRSRTTSGGDRIRFERNSTTGVPREARQDDVVIYRDGQFTNQGHEEPPP